MQTLKILHIGPFPPPIHGMSLANKMLRDGLKNKGHNVETIDTNTEKVFGNQSQRGRFSSRRFFTSSFQILKGITKIIFGRNFNVIYINPSQSVWGYLKYTPFIFASFLRGIPVFIHIHGGYFRTMYDKTAGWKRLLIDQSLKCLSGAIVLGNSLRCLFEGLLPEDKIYVCPNGVEDEIFASEEEVKDKMNRWKNDDTLRILYLSNLMKDKGILDLFQAAAILKSKGIMFQLDIAGAIEPEIKEEVERHLGNLKSEATYHGVVTGERKKQLLRLNHIFCLPTYYPVEGQPISILEAMANGCDIVTTNQGGIKDIVDERYGFFVTKQNPENLAETLLCAWEKTDVGLIAWEEAKKSYSEHQFVERIERIFETSRCSYSTFTMSK
jgi:glycosyltransferase involved in cell wall biosynthesis